MEIHERNKLSEAQTRRTKIITCCYKGDETFIQKVNYFVKLRGYDVEDLRKA